MATGLYGSALFSIPVFSGQKYIGFQPMGAPITGPLGSVLHYDSHAGIRLRPGVHPVRPAGESTSLTCSTPQTSKARVNPDQKHLVISPRRLPPRIPDWARERAVSARALTSPGNSTSSPSHPHRHSGAVLPGRGPPRHRPVPAESRESLRAWGRAHTRKRAQNCP